MTPIPTLRRHKSTGHAWARFDGQQRWFGRFDDPTTHERFRRRLRAICTSIRSSKYHIRLRPLVACGEARLCSCLDS